MYIHLAPFPINHPLHQLINKILRDFIILPKKSSSDPKYKILSREFIHNDSL